MGNKLGKFWYVLARPQWWRALRYRVAPAIEHLKVLESIQPDFLIDVGANRGQFSLVARTLFPDLPILAFEPQREEAAAYRGLFANHQRIQLETCALAESAGTATLHLSRRRDSSSLFPIGKQAELFAATEADGTREVKVERLDSFAERWLGHQNVLLKIDVQGSELNVLKGASVALRYCSHVYVECSEVPLYTGQALFPEVSAYLNRQGLSPVIRINEHYDQGLLIQADHLFVRKKL